LNTHARVLTVIHAYSCTNVLCRACYCVYLDVVVTEQAAVGGGVVIVE
jgi:hypothetical protein